MDTSPVRKEMCDTDNSSSDDFLFHSAVNKQLIEPKNQTLKTRFRTLILERGIKSESEFFQSLGISRQYWYRLSWGINECPSPLKIKIAKALDVDSAVIWDGVQ